MILSDEKADLFSLEILLAIGSRKLLEDFCDTQEIVIYEKVKKGQNDGMKLLAAKLALKHKTGLEAKHQMDSVVKDDEIKKVLKDLVKEQD